jgi:chromosome partitioning protein
MIIGIVNQKGGVGKTTVAVNLASGLAGPRNRVLVLDTDPQGSVYQWQAVAGSTQFAVAHHPRPLKRRPLQADRKAHEWVVVDTPPAMREITRSVLANCDLVIIPIGPSPLDIWSGKETLALVQQAAHRRKAAAALDTRLLICRKLSRTRLGREARDAVAAYGIPVFSSELTQRVAYIEALNAGQSVLTFARRSPAADEIRGLCREVRKIRKERQ